MTDGLFRHLALANDNARERWWNARHNVLQQDLVAVSAERDLWQRECHRCFEDRANAEQWAIAERNGRWFAEATIAALQEPSDKMVEHVSRTSSEDTAVIVWADMDEGYRHQVKNLVRVALSAAVTAAEKEVRGV